MSRKIDFTKMHGLGNDYIYVNADRFPIADPATFSMRWSQPHTGIGSDGLILISRGEVADFRMRIFNADGTEAMMCGNGSRCVGKYVYDKGLTDRTEITLDTLSGIKTISLHITDGQVTAATVDMGEPAFADILLLDESRVDALPLPGTFVSMGNPHFVVFVDDSFDMEHDVERFGREMEFAEAFPERCNIEFARLTADGEIRMRVWERGSGITQACGTGACATAVAAALTNRAACASRIVMDGGALDIEWRQSDNHVYMTGPAETSFEGTLTL